ncbi:MAG: PIG-L deacetylase family protein, partial [Methylococcales bacterium]
MLSETDLIPFQVSSLPPGPWLVFAPHPDDETFGMGGALILARENAIPVTLVVLTDGSLGGAEEPAVVAAVREAEARTVADRLGVSALEFWREPDRGLASTPALVAKIVSALQQTMSATVFFPSPMEYHPDHRVAARAVWRAGRQAGFEGNLWAYEISTEGRINHLVDITRAAQEKRSLMATYRSQVALNDYPDKILG